ncbi:uncharacterized protein SCHCODRAFT_02620459 [Schizophyllum commune H4-8]|uniref:uncharacterized protein n=1 Tax=Schizophyllum commune (strain H4-8 / FGSC 9210) TaxID=578458 RepID=UPI002160E598|nr:uncharacterized protein SCHCODRAFT_02620459 [Schizophyllum commune H4-8]KAI5895867.1 hypothetical protein SCHCODRAFT_02620459 [Schizophyllum commune H4-8]
MVTHDFCQCLVLTVIAMICASATLRRRLSRFHLLPSSLDPAAPLLSASERATFPLNFASSRSSFAYANFNSLAKSHVGFGYPLHSAM